MSQRLVDVPNIDTPIAIIGMGCWLPGASTPRQLWENVLARRREFRRMPDVRTPLADYYDETATDPDKFYQSKVAVIDGFAFDWASYRIPESSYERTDACQWLALEIAHRALADAGFSRETAPKDRTGVFIGNTCTGEGMRSNSLRLRWPVVERALAKAAELEGISSSDIAPFTRVTEDCYKSIFPDVNEDFVAGSISATIAGRICNYFDFHGGAFVIDGACASSLASVMTALNMLASRDLDLALAGGVDISLDPFELVGFSRNGALSKTDIRPYDRRGDGFIAGEGGGMVVLKRLDDARRDGNVVYAVIRGWGMASDGKAGIMQPVASQQAAAIQRAIARAGCKLADLDFVEGHGTGTRAGDRTELEGMSLAMAAEAGDAQEPARACGIGSLKSLIGHTKATAGVASLIKAAAAVNRRVIPPTAACDEPNDAFDKAAIRLFPIRQGEARSADSVLRAGVSAFGFGGINTHLIIESGDLPSQKLAPQADERALLVSNQDSELFVFGGDTKDDVLAKIDAIAADAPALSQSDLVDLAAALANDLPSTLAFRAAVIAGSPDELAEKLGQLRKALGEYLLPADKKWARLGKDVYVGSGNEAARIGFLFPGQGAHQLLMARTLIERFDWARELADEAQRAVGNQSFLDFIYRPIDRARDPSEIEHWTAALASTEIAQPAICLASVLCARFLASLGVHPAVAGGHSLGEITALHAAGAFDSAALFAIASLRGQAMRGQADRPGAMVSLACSKAEAEALLSDVSGTIVVANINSPRQTVLSGEVAAIDAVVARAADREIAHRRLPVSNAFHSPLVASGANAFAAGLASLAASPLDCPVVSGVESVQIDEALDLRAHLARQITSPVDFIALAQEMKSRCDIFIEVGPGRTLSGLCRDIFNDEDSCTPLAANALKWNPNPAIAVAFVNGVGIDWGAFYAQRLVRSYVKPSERLYLSNPAERPIALDNVSSPRLGFPSKAIGPSLEAALAGELGLSSEHLAEYLRHRGHFLAGVARLDMASFGGGGRPLRELPKTGTVNPFPVAAERGGAIGSNLNEVTSLLIELISKRSGYPVSSITSESRLLDDLNLDSIKAGELVAEASRRVGAAGAVDATRFANATIADIAAALFAAAPEAVPSIMPAASDLQPAVAGAPADVLELLFDLTSQRTGYPRTSILADSRLLDDLNLDSIKAGELVAEAARRSGIAGKIDATRFANTSLKDIAAALIEVMPASRPAAVPASQAPTMAAASATPSVGHDLSFVSRYGTWTRNFVVHAEPAPREAHEQGANLAGQVFLIFFDTRDPEPAQALATEIAARGGRAEQVAFDAAARASLQRDARFTHQIAVLPRVPSDEPSLVRIAEIISRVISLAQAPANEGPADRRTSIAYVQFGGGMLGYDGDTQEPELCNALAFARTLHLERKDLRVRVLDFAKSVAPQTLAEHVLEEIAGEAAFSAVGFDVELVRRVPRVTLSNPVAYRPRAIDWSERDVVLVTGGAKGIMAECALGIARETGAALVLIGRGSPGAGGGDSEIDRTLERFRAEGLRHAYYSCDIVDAKALAETIGKIETEVGAITCVIHGASVLRPSRTENLTVDGLLQEVSPKVLGAWNLCEALRQKPLKLFVAFSSLVVDHGMPWSAGYAFANELMERVVQHAATMSPTLPLQIISFGLWGEVGRPAVLKTNDHLLSVGLHDGEIPPDEGVRRLVEVLTLDPGVARLCIYGRSVGYPTWDQLRALPPVPRNLRFIERVLHFEPDVELIARCHLSLRRDRYLHDHVYNGMYIVPTVLALEALAQAANALIGHATALCRLEAVEMPYPIVVDPTEGLDIELHAEVQEATADGTRRINVSVTTAQTGFKTVALAGTVVFGQRRAARSQSTTLGKPVSIDARADLYDRQFFVGPLYQRMGTIYSVDPARAICQAEIHAEAEAAREVFTPAGVTEDRLVLGDPYFRDTLLHSSLLHHLDHMAFTVRIDKIEFFEGCEAGQADQRLCVARLCWSSGKDAEYELVAASANGRVAERWTGFNTKALARTSDWPALQDLLDIERSTPKDERELADRIADAAGALGVTAPVVALGCVAGFSALPPADRHIYEGTLAERAVAIAAPDIKQKPKLTWLANGRPQIETEAGLDISFSHEGWYCLCAMGSEAQGCDLAAITHRDDAEWTSLLGTGRASLLATLSAEESRDVAGTRIWAAIEAARKALAADNEELTFVKRVEASVLFRARTPDKEILILTLPLRFTHGPKYIVALTVSGEARLEETGPEPASLAQIVRDADLGCDVLEHAFSVSWKECTTASHKVMAGCYVDWFHRIRETMLSPQDARRWVAGVLDGTAGLVARAIHVQVHDEATAHDELCGRIWITQLSETGVRWRIEFSKAGQMARKLVATVEAEGGMVGIDSSGSRSRDVANVARDYGRFVQTQDAVSGAENHALEKLQKGASLFEAPPGPQGGPLLFSETVRPSLMDSDLVGNVSSITFFTWLAHVRDHFLYSIVPKAMVRRVGSPSSNFGEALCIDEEMTYLREAFPFDEITVEMRLISATERSARLRYDFIRMRQGGSEKLAIGHQQLFWVHRDADGALRSQNFPTELLRLMNPRESVELPRMAGGKQ